MTKHACIQILREYNLIVSNNVIDKSSPFHFAKSKHRCPIHLNIKVLEVCTDHLEHPESL